MDCREGGCCIARYDGGTGRNPYDTSKIDRIMLRFRPIAPKPVLSGSGEEKTSDVLVRNGGGRTKRRYVKDTTKTRRKSNSKKRKLRSDQDDQTAAVITLSLLPEKPYDESASPSLPPVNHHRTVRNAYVPPPAAAAAWCQNSPSPASSSGGSGSGRSGGGAGLSTTSSSSKECTVVIPQPVRPVGSCVTIIRCITEEIGLGLLGRTDEEKMINLEKDACPGFISDSVDRVRWTNESYRKLVNQDGFGSDERPEMVWLVMNESLPLRTCEEGFVCRVRLQYTCKKERHSLIVPCDVWKMNGGGGYAWRLDVKAALSLGR